MYAARERPLAGVSAELVARGAAREGATTVAVRERAGVIERVVETVRAGDVVFTLGAGDITRVGPELLARLGTAAGRDRGRAGASGGCWASRGRRGPGRRGWGARAGCGGRAVSVGGRGAWGGS